MYCHHCGQPEHRGAAFCPTTGAPLAAKAGVTAAGLLAQPSPSTLSASSYPLKQHHPGTVVILSVLTLGIYGLAMFYQCAQSYRERSPGSAPNFPWMFWAYVVTSALGLLTLSKGVGVLVVVASVVIGAMMLNEVSRARDAVAMRSGAIGLMTSEHHVILWTLGNVLALVLIGFVLLIIQALRFFHDHNRIVTAVFEEGDEP